MIHEFDNLKQDLEEKGLPNKEASIRLIKEYNDIQNEINKLNTEIAKAITEGKISEQEMMLLKQTVSPVIEKYKKKADLFLSEINGEAIILFDARETILLQDDPFHKIELGIN